MLNTNGNLLSLHKPLVMGIINATPDSFFSESRAFSENAVAKKAEAMLEDGANILDIGACSTRPFAPEVSEAEEISRLRFALSAIRVVAPNAYLSVDTYRASVARMCVEEYGVDIINDISGGDFDPAMFDTVAQLHVPYVVMHTTGKPDTMQINPTYSHVVAEVIQNLSKKISKLRRMGVCDIIIDPGFGFGKTIEQNYQMLQHLSDFQLLNAPILVGVSRKSMIYKPLQCTAEEALNGTTAIHTIALMKGAHILRTHDVKEAVEAVKLFQMSSII
ncbi:MAG: dihydropteroate synthase [Bacteroidaceae bacterium]|nr:dihydropteroate synthase [Bacteroidaceae bacterium]